MGSQTSWPGPEDPATTAPIEDQGLSEQLNWVSGAGAVSAALLRRCKRRSRSWSRWRDRMARNGSNAQVLDLASSIVLQSQLKGVIMAKVIMGNHSAVVLPRAEQDRIREFYRDVLGCEIMERLI
jgi:hypothetical protein